MHGHIEPPFKGFLVLKIFFTTFEKKPLKEGSFPNQAILSQKINIVNSDKKFLMLYKDMRLKAPLGADECFDF
jgi:hypothetical protein